LTYLSASEARTEEKKADATEVASPEDSAPSTTTVVQGKDQAVDGRPSATLKNISSGVKETSFEKALFQGSLKLTQDRDLVGEMILSASIQVLRNISVPTPFIGAVTFAKDATLSIDQASVIRGKTGIYCFSGNTLKDFVAYDVEKFDDVNSQTLLFTMNRAVEVFKSVISARSTQLFVMEGTKLFLPLDSIASSCLQGEDLIQYSELRSGVKIVLNSFFNFLKKDKDSLIDLLQVVLSPESSHSITNRVEQMRIELEATIAANEKMFLEAKAAPRGNNTIREQILRWSEEVGEMDFSQILSWSQNKSPEGLLVPSYFKTATRFKRIIEYVKQTLPNKILENAGIPPATIPIMSLVTTESSPPADALEGDIASLKLVSCLMSTLTKIMEVSEYQKLTKNSPEELIVRTLYINLTNTYQLTVHSNSLKDTSGMLMDFESAKAALTNSVALRTALGMANVVPVVTFILACQRMLAKQAIEKLVLNGEEGRCIPIQRAVTIPIGTAIVNKLRFRSVKIKNPEYVPLAPPAPEGKNPRGGARNARAPVDSRTAIQKQAQISVMRPHWPCYPKLASCIVPKSVQQNESLLEATFKEGFKIIPKLASEALRPRDNLKEVKTSIGEWVSRVYIIEDAIKRVYENRRSRVLKLAREMNVRGNDGKYPKLSQEIFSQAQRAFEREFNSGAYDLGITFVALSMPAMPAVENVEDCVRDLLPRGRYARFQYVPRKHIFGAGTADDGSEEDPASEHLSDCDADEGSDRSETE